MRPDHTPVLAKECIDLLGCANGGTYVDCTSGEGGHTELILQSSPKVRTISLDLDPDMLERAKARLSEFDGRTTFIHSNFANIDKALVSQSIGMVNGILADLGISMAHIRSVDRGIAFTSNQMLDMRLDPTNGKPLKDMLPGMGENQIFEIIRKYGEDPMARKISRAITSALALKPIETTTELAELIEKAVGRHGRTHPATRTFQAFRIWINNELDNLETFLPKAIRMLLPGGTLAIISYHSLEDRIVKDFFKDVLDEGFEIVTKKPITASEEEILLNRASRSAKLRALRRSSGR
ncbi:MAG: 16S rRNA (cytosine(1402)-N(4))-methyltransferase RsmH [Caldiserica bacterium]|nr:16S rRNA (cytosine(1402)-N(4))-methyltransferase RsmH [Caldisericota bacterium]